MSCETPILQTDKRVTKTSPDLDPREEWYKISLTASDAIEIHINNLTHPASSIEIFDVYKNKLTGSVFAPNSGILLPFFPMEDGLYFIKLTIGPDPDPSHVYQLIIDKYTGLSGTIVGSRLLTPENGPYMVGPEDLIIPAGSCLTVDAGSTINVRGKKKIVVKDAGAFYLNGGALKPITIIGATGDPQKHECNQFSLSLLAETGALHVLLQYDTDEDGIDFLTSPSPYVAATSSVEEFTAVTGKSPLLERARIIPPAARLDYIKNWFLQASPYRFSFLEELFPYELYFGIDVHSFADWELESTRVCSNRYEAGQLNYWDFVNGNFTADLLEAAHLFANHQSSPDLRIQRMIELLALGQGWHQKYGYFKWYDLIKPFSDEDEEFYKTFEHMATTFWLAHNTSIVYWDKIARELGLWANENPFEQQFINSVIIRVHFAADLPFTIPGYRNNIPPVGLVAITINFGPLSYPKQYPVPEPDQDVNYGTLSTASYLKFLFETLIKGQTNPIYTWWLPSQADASLYSLMNEKGITLESPPEDWNREFVQPSQKTLEEIQAYYLDS